MKVRFGPGRLTVRRSTGSGSRSPRHYLQLARLALWQVPVSDAHEKPFIIGHRIGAGPPVPQTGILARCVTRDTWTGFSRSRIRGPGAAFGALGVSHRDTPTTPPPHAWGLLRFSRAIPVLGSASATDAELVRMHQRSEDQRAWYGPSGPDSLRRMLRLLTFGLRHPGGAAIAIL